MLQCPGLWASLESSGVWAQSSHSTVQRAWGQRVQYPLLCTLLGLIQQDAGEHNWVNKHLFRGRSLFFHSQTTHCFLWRNTNKVCLSKVLIVWCWHLNTSRQIINRFFFLSMSLFTACPPSFHMSDSVSFTHACLLFSHISDCLSSFVFGWVNFSPSLPFFPN